MIGVIRIGNKYFNLANDEEITVQIHVHETYGNIKYLNYTHNEPCETCLGTGKVGGEEHGDDCTDCDGNGNVSEDELAVECNYPNQEDELRHGVAPNNWNEGGI